MPATAARLVLMHQPASFGDIPAHAAPVAIAGHSHGGQIRLPIVSRGFWLGYSDRERLPREGWVPGHDGAPGNALYVNRGIGFSRWPIRINAPPELTVLTLQVGHGRHRGGAGVKREPWRS